MLESMNARILMAWREAGSLQRAGSGDVTLKTERVFVAHLTKGSPCTATSPVTR